MFLKFFCILILGTPAVWALYDDRNGDKHPNRDLVKVTIITFVAAPFVALIDPHTTFLLDTIRALVLAGGIYVAVFPYAVNFMLWKRGILNTSTWWDHLSATAWPDRLGIWQQTPWYGRVLFAIIVLIAAAIIYGCPGQILFYGNGCFCGLDR